MKKIISTITPFLLVGGVVGFFIWNYNTPDDVSIADKSYISRDYKKAISIYESNQKILTKRQLINLADSYYKVGRIEDSTLIYEDMAKNGDITNEYLASFYFKVAKWNDKTNNIEEAEKYYDMSIKEAQSPSLLIDIKEEYGIFISKNATDDNIEKGIRYLKEVSDLPSNKHNYDLLMALGDLYYFSGQFKQAVSTWDKITKENHQYVPAYEKLGILMLDIGEYEEALEMFKKGINYKRNWHLYFGMAESYYHLNDYGKALKNYQEVLNVNPKHYPSHYQMYLIYLDRGNKKAASEHLYQIAKNSPDSELGRMAKKELKEHLPNMFDENLLEKK